MTVGEQAEPAPCRACAVRRRGICGALAAEELKSFRTIASRRSFARGQHIHVAEADQEFFGAIVSGAVKLIKILVDGRQQVVGLLLPSDSVGRAFARRSPYFAQATGEVELCCFSYPAFERMLADFPGLKQRLLEQTLDERDAALDWMVLLGRKTAEERVASFLLMLTRRTAALQEAGAPSPYRFDLPLKREEIADFLGLTYETVCRQLKVLKDRGLIELMGRRRVTVLDFGRLAEAAG